MPRLFLSYSHQDEARAQGLQVLLEATGHDVFVAARSILPGQRWEAQIDAALQGCDQVMVFWTQRAAASLWVRREVESALRWNKPLVPLRFDETPLAWALAEIQAADMIPMVDELLALRRDLDRLGLVGDARDDAVRKLLAEKGLSLSPKKERKLFGFFSSSASAAGFWGLARSAGAAWVAHPVAAALGAAVFASLAGAGAAAAAIPAPTILATPTVWTASWSGPATDVVSPASWRGADGAIRSLSWSEPVVSAERDAVRALGVALADLAQVRAAADVARSDADARLLAVTGWDDGWREAVEGAGAWGGGGKLPPEWTAPATAPSWGVPSSLAFVDVRWEGPPRSSLAMVPSNEWSSRAHRWSTPPAAPAELDATQGLIRALVESHERWRAFGAEVAADVARLEEEARASAELRRRTSKGLVNLLTRGCDPTVAVAELADLYAGDAAIPPAIAKHAERCIPF